MYFVSFKCFHECLRDTTARCHFISPSNVDHLPTIVLQNTFDVLERARFTKEVVFHLLFNVHLHPHLHPVTLHSFSQHRDLKLL